MEKIQYESNPNVKVILYWIVVRCSLIIIAFAFFIYVGIFIYEIQNSGTDFVNRLGRATSIAVVSGIGIAILVSFYLNILRKTYHYRITDKGIYFQGGIMLKKQKFIPHDEITNTEIKQTIVERILRVSRLGIQTAGFGGQQKPEIVFEGLDDVDEVKKLINKNVQIKPR